MSIKRVAVIGAGIMGRGIAQVFALGGCDVRIADSDAGALASGMDLIRRGLEDPPHGGHETAQDGARAGQRIHAAASLREAVQDADLVTECVREDLVTKQKLFAEIEAAAPIHAILASNTSSLRLSDIGQFVRDRSRLVITHYFNPAQIMPIVEIAGSPATDAAVIESTRKFLASVGKTPIVLRREIPGFVVNRIQAAMAREALFLLEQGIVTAEELDRAIRGSVGPRLAAWGPFEVMDLGGLDVWVELARNLFPQLSDERTVPVSLRQKVHDGSLGAKSGLGFYPWSPEAVAEKTRVVQSQLSVPKR